MAGAPPIFIHSAQISQSAFCDYSLRLFRLRGRLSIFHKIRKCILFISDMAKSGFSM
jgi:hypothetical protein